MAARATGSATISFGLVSIPIKIYSSASTQGISFHMLHRTCGTRVRMQLYCPHDKEVVARRDTVKGYEHAKDQFVRFEDEELKKLEAERTDQLDILEFVPESTIDPVYIADTDLVGPGKGGERAYKLLGESMSRTRKVAVGRFWSHGKTSMVLLRPYRGGLMLQHLHYAEEVRSMDEIERPSKVAFKPVEEELADKLVEQLSVPEFAPSRFKDEYKERVLAAVEQKVAGREVVSAPAAPQAQIFDLFEALKRSLAKGEGAAAAPANESTPPPAPEAEAELAVKPIKKAAPKRAPREKKQAAPLKATELSIAPRLRSRIQGRVSSGDRFALFAFASLAAGCRGKEAPPRPDPTPLASATASTTASAAPSASAPAANATTVSATADAGAPAWACPDASVWIPSGVKLGTDTCPVYGAKAKLPPYELTRVPCDALTPAGECYAITGVLTVDPLSKPPTAVTEVKCGEHDVVLTLELTGKVLAGVAVADKHGFSEDGSPGRCEITVPAMSAGHVVVALFDTPNAFSFRTKSITLATFGGPTKGALQRLYQVSSERWDTEVQVGPRGYVAESTSATLSAVWGHEVTGQRYDEHSTSVDRLAMAGDRIFYRSILGLAIGKISGEELPVTRKSDGFVDTIAGDDTHVAWSASWPKMKRRALLAAPVPEDAAKLAPMRYATKLGRVLAVGCGRALLAPAEEKAKPELELLRLSDGATAVLSVAKAPEGRATLTCDDAYFVRQAEVQRVPLTAFPAAAPPTDAPVAASVEHPFDAPDAGAPDAGSDDAGADGGTPASTDAGKGDGG
jgi:DNA end-binding protein Ku